MRVRDVDSDSGGLAIFDKFFEQHPLAFTVYLAAFDFGVTIYCVQAAVRAAAERQPFDAFLFASIKENIDGAATRREDRGRDEREKYRVFVVLAADDEPHLHAMFSHQSRQHSLKSKLEPLLLDFSLFAQTGNRLLGLRDRRKR